MFVVLSITWVCGPPIEMKINHGGTEVTEKTLKKLKLPALRVSVVNDFRRSEAAAPPRRVAESKGPYSRSRLSWERSSRSVPYVLQQLLDFSLLVRRERQQRQTRDAAEAPVVIHGILHTWDA